MRYYYKGSELQWPHGLELYVRDTNFFHFNWHPEFELSIVLKGNISLVTDGVSRLLAPGDVFLVNPNRGHTWFSTDRDSATLSVHFAPEFISDFEPSIGKFEIDCVSTPLTRGEPRFARVRKYAERMMLYAVSQNPGSVFFLRGSLAMLAGTLFTEFPVRRGSPRESVSDRKNRKTLRAVIDWIENNFDRKITLDAAAKVAGYNRTYFSAFFRRNVGIPFFDYLRRTRFRHALTLLGTTDGTLTEIAADCGFPDLKSFSSYYKKLVHELPGARRMSWNTSASRYGGEGERVFLTTSVPGIDDALRTFAGSPGSASRTGPLAADRVGEYLERMDGLCERMLALSRELRGAGRV